MVRSTIAADRQAAAAAAAGSRESSSLGRRKNERKTKKKWRRSGLICTIPTPCCSFLFGTHHARVHLR